MQYAAIVVTNSNTVSDIATIDSNVAAISILFRCHATDLTLAATDSNVAVT